MQQFPREQYSWPPRERPEPAVRRALLGVVAATGLYVLLDLAIGLRYSTDPATAVVSGVVGLALQVLVVVLVWQRRTWAWVVGAVVAVVGALGAVVLLVRPTASGYASGTPGWFLAVQALLVLVAAGLWFFPGVRPRRAGSGWT